MPQTIEHLAIVDLLGIKHGVIALTKSDLVDEDWLPLVEDEIRAALQKTALKDAPVIPVSGKTGMGLTELKDAIDKIAQQIVFDEDHLPFRLPVDRVFTMQGAGTVVTGTLWSGKIKLDDKVLIFPSGKEARVRNVQVHGEKSETAIAGQRVALNLVGPSKDDLNRGDVVLAPGYLSPTYMIDAHFRLLDNAPRDLKNRSRVRIHHGTSEVLGRVVLTDRDILNRGETAFVQLRLEKPLVVKYGDNYVVRSYSPIQTIGGGGILDSHPAKFRAANKQVFTERCQVLLESETDKILYLYLGEAKGFMTADMLASRCEIEPDKVMTSLKNIKRSGDIVHLVIDKQESYMMKSKFDSATSSLEAFLNQNFKKNPLNPWLGKQIIKSQLLDWMSDKEFDAFLSVLQESGKVIIEKNQVAHAKAKVSVAGEDEKTIAKLFEKISSGRYAPPETTAIAKEMGIDLKKVNSMADLMVREHKLARIAPNMYFEAALIEQAKAEIKTRFAGKQITPSELRDILDTSRKYIIPILNYFDTIGVTRRQGEARIVR
jgi:selenocysteine-specific elongation factor